MSCIADNCENDAVARGMCKKHWRRWSRGKDINAPTIFEKSTSELFMEKVEKSETGCWLWKGSKRGRAPMMYGSAWYEGGHIGAHRLSWILFRGDIGDLHVLHRCDVPLCVNPDHLFLGTHTDNMRDKTEKKRGFGGKTHCKYGHEFTEENTYYYEGKKGTARHCRTCHKLTERDRRQRVAVGG